MDGRRHERAARAAAAIVALAPLGPASPAGAEVIRLVGGDVITAEVVERTDERIVIEHSALGRLELAPDQVQTVAVDADDLAAREAPPPDTSWKSRFDLGGSGSFGSTDTQSLTVAVTSRRETDRDRTRLDLRYFYGATNGDRDENRLTTGILHDWLIPESPWFWFASGRYDYDEFQSWEHRIGAHAGPGYQLIDNEDFTLRLRGGPGFSKEFKSIDEEFRWEALAGVDGEWKISEKQSLTFDATIFPDLSNTGEFRTLTNAGWKVKLDDEANMSFTAGLRWEHQSDVDPGSDEDDLDIFAGLGFDF